MVFYSVCKTVGPRPKRSRYATQMAPLSLSHWLVAVWVGWQDGPAASKSLIIYTIDWIQAVDSESGLHSGLVDHVVETLLAWVEVANLVAACQHCRTAPV